MIRLKIFTYMPAIEVLFYWIVSAGVGFLIGTMLA